MKDAGRIVLGVVVLGAVLVLMSSLYTVQMTDQVILTQFGKPIGTSAVTNAGLHFKIPFVQEVNRIEKRFLQWDGTPNEMPTKDKTYILVDTFARWRISDAFQYFRRLRDERSALSRLNDILGSETRNAIARHELIEMVRTTKERQPYRDSVLTNTAGEVGTLFPITKGRATVQQEIFEAAAPKLLDFGIELLDIRFKRINYNRTVRSRIYDRMISERQQIAERFRSEGAGEAAKIEGKKERDLEEIQSVAYRTIQEVMGAADAEATEIYAKAYNQTPESRKFYEFTKTLETYRNMVDPETSIVLSTDSDLFKFLKSASPKE